MTSLLLLSFFSLPIGCTNDCDAARATTVALWEKLDAEQAWCADFDCAQMVSTYRDQPAEAEYVFMTLMMGHRALASAMRRDNAEELDQAFPGFREARESSMQTQGACN